VLQVSNNSMYNLSLAICRLPVDTGPCTGGYYKRWYFDEDRLTCIPFIYTGCAGNRNRFRNFQTCLNFCYAEGRKCEIV
jgi:Kunitz/Bovine pancreatic trypsin inhibitor domain.